MATVEEGSGGLGSRTPQVLKGTVAEIWWFKLIFGAVNHKNFSRATTSFSDIVFIYVNMFIYTGLKIEILFANTLCYITWFWIWQWIPKLHQLHLLLQILSSVQQHFKLLLLLMQLYLSHFHFQLWLHDTENTRKAFMFQTYIHSCRCYIYPSGWNRNKLVKAFMENTLCTALIFNTNDFTVQIPCRGLVCVLCQDMCVNMCELSQVTPPYLSDVPLMIPILSYHVSLATLSLSPPPSCWTRGLNNRRGRRNVECSTTRKKNPQR